MLADTINHPSHLAGLNVLCYIFYLLRMHIDVKNSMNYSCETVALQENFVDRTESYDSFSAKSCAFLAYGLGYISPFP
jgi:hypothetical protein